jgi:hypothetical protein
MQRRALVLAPFAVAGLAARLAARPAGPRPAPGPLAVCDYTQGKVFLLDSAGQPVWSHDAPDTNDLWVLPSGNLLFTTGHGVVETTREKRVVFRDESKDEIYACQRLANGNTGLSNWLGHGHEGDAPLLLEVTPDKRVVWTYENHALLRTASSVLLLDDSGREPRTILAH